MMPAISPSPLSLTVCRQCELLGLPRSSYYYEPATASEETTLREKLVKIAAKVVAHAKYVIFQLAEVAVPRNLFGAILERIGRMRQECASG
jgi:hypothetical protein